MSAPAYIEFAVQSNFSFLRGASKPEELVVTAALLGHAGMGLADRNTVAGVVRAWSQSKHVKFEGEAIRSAPLSPRRPAGLLRRHARRARLSPGP